jgi:hypothetical protein
MQQEEIMKWYSTLTIDQKIMLKSLCNTILGVGFNELGPIFTFRERIEMLYNKLKMEGFQI